MPRPMAQMKFGIPNPVICKCRGAFHFRMHGEDVDDLRKLKASMARMSIILHEFRVPPRPVFRPTTLKSKGGESDGLQLP